MPETNCGSSSSNSLVIMGPLLGVSIGFDPMWQPSQPQPPVLDLINIPALVDTGSTESCIDNLLGSELGLPIVDRRGVFGIHGVKKVNMYLAQIYIPRVDRTIYGAFAGVDLTTGGQFYKALIGRGFLQNFIMTYNGRSGTVTISW